MASTVLRTTLQHLAVSLIVWLLATVAFGWWLKSAVDEEYRLGFRTADQGDAIMIPIAGFGLLLGAGLVAANLLLFGVRWWRRRRLTVAG